MIAELALAGWVGVAVLLHRLLHAREQVARACHEVRGPLTAAGLALVTMERAGALPAECVAALDEQLRRARLAADDLAGIRGERVEHVTLASLLADLHVAWAPVCAARGRGLAVGAAPPGLTVLADRIRLAQAAGNLIANALEHGAGTVELRVRAGGDRVRLEVRDEGGGVRESVPRPRFGSGVRGRGLVIAAGVAERHGGRLLSRPVPALELPLLEAGR